MVPLFFAELDKLYRLNVHIECVHYVQYSLFLLHVWGLHLLCLRETLCTLVKTRSYTFIIRRKKRWWSLLNSHDGKGDRLLL